MVQLRNSQCSRCAFILIVISVFISIAYYSYLVKDKTIVVSEQVEVEPLDFLKKVFVDYEQTKASEKAAEIGEKDYNLVSYKIFGDSELFLNF